MANRRHAPEAKTPEAKRRSTARLHRFQILALRIYPHHKRIIEPAPKLVQTCIRVRKDDEARADDGGVYHDPASCLAKIAYGRDVLESPRDPADPRRSCRLMESHKPEFRVLDWRARIGLEEAKHHAIRRRPEPRVPLITTLGF